MTSQFAYKKVLLVGATSGIGRALADKMIANNISVIAVGRRQENLDDFTKSHNTDSNPSMASSSRFDISSLSSIPSWSQEVTTQHPDIDFILLNSGIQRGFNFAEPSTVDLDVIHEEITTNYTSYIHLVTALLPHLQKRAKEIGKATGLAFTTSGLGLVPLVSRPNYSASKAGLHAFILCLRAQLKDAKSQGEVKCIEILPPAVQTELHDKKHQPDIENGRNMGMPLDVFMEKCWKGLCDGKEQIPIGMAERGYEVPDGYETRRQEHFRELNEARKGGKGN